MAKILIVEDDDEIAQIERDYLEMGGYEVDVKNDGSGIAELLVRESYDLLVLDLMLPGASGCDICKAVRDKIDIPILMVTAKPKQSTKSGGLDSEQTIILQSHLILPNCWQEFSRT